MESETVNKLIYTLSFSEREIIKLRYGIGVPDGYKYTLEECSRIFKVTGERIRQIQMKAEKKLRAGLKVLKKRIANGE